MSNSIVIVSRWDFEHWICETKQKYEKGMLRIWQIFKSNSRLSVSRWDFEHLIYETEQKYEKVMLSMQEYDKFS